MNKNKGITLIALIITIIVMMILVGVTVAITLNNGLFKRTQEGAFKYEIEKLQEQIYGSREINKYKNYTGLTVDITMPEELKDFIEYDADAGLVYIGDITKIQCTWAKEMGIVVKEEHTVKQKIEELMQLANKYVEEGKSTTDANLLALQYIRRNKYTGGNWTRLAGEVDTTFVQYVENNKTKSLDIVDLTDPVTGENIDFVHEMASLNVYLKKASSTDILKQYACWAGDLCTLVTDVNKVYKDGDYTSSELKNLTKNKLGGNSSFGLADMLADVDAANISTIIIATGSPLDETIYNYYYGTNSEKSKNRYSEFVTYLRSLGISSSTTNYALVRNVARNLLGLTGSLTSGRLYASQLISNYSSIPTDVFETVATCFAEYITERI